MQKSIDSGLYSTKRIEALIDGIYAIAMTFLMLSIEIPDLRSFETDKVTQKFIHFVYPQFINYIISFSILGLFWLLNHSIFYKLQKIKTSMMLTVVFFLLFSALIPFSTELIDDHGTFFISAFFSIYTFLR